MMGVYAFLPDMRGKCGIRVDYIGVSKNVENRVRQHFANERMFANYGSGQIVCQQFADIEEAIRCESRLISKFEPMYNRTRKRHRLRVPAIWNIENLEALLLQQIPRPWNTGEVYGQYGHLE